MSKPLLQVALDTLDLPAAVEAVHKLGDSVDIIEAGTILCYAEGIRAVAALAPLRNGRPLVADLKIADAGKTLAEMAFSHGATWTTVITAAPFATLQMAYEQAKKVEGGDIQIELYGNWTFEEAQKWYDLGIRQVIFHRGRDAQAMGQEFGDEEVSVIRKLADKGFDVSVTGGISVEEISLFKNIRVKTFIAGRSLWAAKDPRGEALKIKAEIDRHF